jgi:hypothetical protein
LVDKYACRNTHAVRTKISEIGIDKFLTEHCVQATVT